MSELRDALVALRDKYAGRAWVTGHDINDIVASLDALLSRAPREEPNELTRQTMTASEAGENVVSFENVDALIADLDSPREEPVDDLNFVEDALIDAGWTIEDWTDQENGITRLEAIMAALTKALAASPAKPEAQAEEIARLRGALKWYATPQHYGNGAPMMGGGKQASSADIDGGQRARAALADKPSGEGE